jgi:ATP-binding cassette, subfamily B, bacterial PglK
MLPFLVFVFLFSSLLDLVGIGLIGPYIALVLDPEKIGSILVQVFDRTGLTIEHEALLPVLGFVLIGIFLIKAITSIGIQYLIFSFSNFQRVRLQIFLMQAYQYMPFTEYLQRNSSEYIYNIQSLTGNFSVNVIMNILNATSNFIVGIVILGLLAWTDVTTVVILLGILSGLVFVYDRIFKNKLRKYGEQINSANTKMVAAIQEGIGGFKEIRILGIETHFHKKVKRGARIVSKYQLKNLIISSVPNQMLEVVLVSFVVIMITNALFNGMNLQGLIPTLTMFGVAALRMKPAALSISNCLTSLRFSRNSVSRLYKDLKCLQLPPLESTVKVKKNIETPGLVQPNKNRIGVFKSLTLRNLNFHYPKALRDALSNISMEIHAGESIGLIGASGAGKTTIVDVLLGLLEHNSGEAIYNGRPLIENLAEWRTQVAYLPQDVFLIDNTLRHNVALGIDEENIDDVRLKEALQKARLEEMVKQLPKGVETILGEHGVRLSGGQRQRVALARAFYHDRKVLVMDEATSSLDNETEQEIIEEIQHLKGRITLIVIAHRLTTVQHCDRIYHMENGSIIKHGTYKEVVETPLAVVSK